jgi:NADH-quinone oxidoreductase subunit G
VTEAPWGEFGEQGAMDATPFALPIKNFYMTDPISRASETMAQCTRVFGAAGARTGTHG